MSTGMEVFLNYVVLNLIYTWLISFRAVSEWINIGRWRFDPSRGLRLDCKNPQRSDTELRGIYGVTGTSTFEEGNAVVIVSYMLKLKHVS